MMSGDLTPWRGFSDSEIGPLHRRISLPNQDACHIELESWPALIAVSDGVGSRLLSDQGAQAACRAVKRLSRECTVDTFTKPDALIEQFHAFWLDELQDVDIDQCSCTALFVILLQEETFIAQLGDGACCIVTSDGSGKQLKFLSDKDDELFANQTDSLGRVFRTQDWQYCVLPTKELLACFLVTDGIADDISPEYRADFFLELLSKYQQLTDAEIRDDVRSWLSDWPVKGHSDDKTIAGLFRQLSTADVSDSESGRDAINARANPKSSDVG